VAQRRVCLCTKELKQVLLSDRQPGVESLSIGKGGVGQPCQNPRLPLSRRVRFQSTSALPVFLARTTRFRQPLLAAARYAHVNARCLALTASSASGVHRMYNLCRQRLPCCTRAKGSALVRFNGPCGFWFLPLRRVPPKTFTAATSATLSACYPDFASPAGLHPAMQSPTHIDAAKPLLVYRRGCGTIGALPSRRAVNLHLRTLRIEAAAEHRRQRNDVACEGCAPG
jgi:hypothetical protein